MMPRLAISEGATVGAVAEGVAATGAATAAATAGRIDIKPANPAFGGDKG